MRLAPGQRWFAPLELGTCLLRKHYHGRPGYGHSDRFQRRKVKTSKRTGPLVWYSRKLDTHPILTKSLSSAIIGGSGDILSQYIVARNANRSLDWDYVRTSRFAFMGIVLIGPVIHVWYGAVMRWFPGNSFSSIVRRVAVDQLLFSPLFLPTFLSGLWLLEGKSPDQVISGLQHTVPTAIVANWALWVPAQAINFRFIPGKYQVLFSNFVGFIWNAYLSYTAHSE